MFGVEHGQTFWIMGLVLPFEKNSLHAPSQIPKFDIQPPRSCYMRACSATWIKILFQHARIRIDGKWPEVQHAKHVHKTCVLACFGPSP